MISRRELAGRWAEKLGRPLHHMNFYMALAFWRLAAIIEGRTGYTLLANWTRITRAGLIRCAALLAEASAAAGDW